MMGILKKDKEEKPIHIVAIDFNTSPIGLVKVLNFFGIVLMFVAWLNPYVAMLLYIVGEMSMIVLLFAGFDLKREGKSYGWQIYVFFILTLFFGGFMFSSSYPLFLAGAYLTALSGAIVPYRWLQKKMHEDESFAEVMKVGYYEKA